MIQTISDKLKTLFETLKGTKKPFVNVLDYHTLDNTWYPYLTFEPIQFNATILDSCNNERTYVFELLIFQEETETGWRKDAKEILTKAMDDVIDILDKNYTLDWAVLYVQPVSWTITPFITNTWKVLVWRMEINAKASKFIW